MESGSFSGHDGERLTAAMPTMPTMQAHRI
jgi:hypothetical protein